MQERWFTSDTHFGHSAIVDYHPRPYESVEKMDEGIIKNWNSIVGPKDFVYHLGDFSFGRIDPYITRLNGCIHIILGNHDKGKEGRFKQFTKEYGRGKIVSISWLKVIDFDNITITLCHYAMLRWCKSQYNQWHLFGHSHCKTEGVGKSFDVGVDCWNYYPINFEQVKTKMATLPDNIGIKNEEEKT